jgi:hypothetical protein
VTLAQLESAHVPSLCGHPAGRLVHGVLPGIAAPAGRVALAATPTHHGAATLAYGDLNHDGVRDAAAVVLCRTGSTSRPSSIQLYTARGKRLAGFDLAAYTHRPTDVVSKVTIVHDVVFVHWTANQHGDAPGVPTLDYAVQLRLVGHKVVASHAQSYKDAYVAETLERAAFVDKKSTLHALATPKVAAQLVAAEKRHSIGAVFSCYGSPLRDSWRGQTLDAFHLYGAAFPAWGKTSERYCVSLNYVPSTWSVIRMKHVGWRQWKADLFVQAKA